MRARWIPVLTALLLCTASGGTGGALHAQRQAAAPARSVAADVVLTTQLGHAEPVLSISVSPDGRYILSGSADQTACLWEAATGLELRRFEGHTAQVASAGFFPDGARVFTASWDGVVRILQTSSGSEVRRMEHAPRVYAAALSRDGRLLVTGGQDGTARVWNTETGAELRRVISDEWVEGVAISPDGRLLMTASRPSPLRNLADRVPSTLRLWDVATGSERARFVGHTDIVQSVAFSPDGRSALSASADGTARLWDIASGRESRKLEGHTAWVTSAQFAPDAATIVTGSFDKTVRVWDARAGTQLRVIKAEVVRDLTISPDNRSIISGESVETTSGIVRTLDPKTGAELRRFEHGAAGLSDLAISPDGMLVTLGRDRVLQVWDGRTGAERQRIAAEGYAFSPAFTLAPDGRSVVTLLGGTVRRRDLATRAEIAQLDNARYQINDAAFSPDGATVFGASSDGVGWLWDGSGEVVRVFHASASNTSPIRAVAFSSSGKFVATGGDDRVLRVWDVASGGDQRDLPGHTDQIAAVAISPDDSWILSGSFDMTAKLWPAQAGGAPKTLAGHTGGVRSVAFSSDGKLAITGSFDRTVRLWDVRSGAPQRTLSGHTLTVTAVRALADGTIASASEDGTVRLWSVAGKLLRTIDAKIGPIEAMAASRDGRMIAIGSRTGGIRLLSPQTGADIRALRAIDRSVNAVSFSSDGSRLLVAGSDGIIRLRETATGADVRLIESERPNALEAAFTPDGTHVITASIDGIRVLNAATGTIARRFDTHQTIARSVAVSPDGTLAASGGNDRMLRIWEIATGTERRVLAGHRDYVGAVAFSPDGKFVASGSGDRLAAVWDITSSKPVAVMQGLTRPVQQVVFSPDGSTLATVSLESSARLWNARTGQLLRTLGGHRGNVTSIRFSSDGRTVLTAADDGMVRVWDTASGRELCRLMSFRKGGWAVVDGDGRYDASGAGAVSGLHWIAGLNAIRLDQLKERYFDPGLLAKYLGLNAEPPRDVRTFANVALFPSVEVHQPDLAKQLVRLRVTDQGGGIGPVSVRLNGKEIAADARGPKPPRTVNGVMELTVPLPKALLAAGVQNEIEVVAYNAEGYLSTRGLRLPFTPPAAAAQRAPRLWAVVAGVSDYEGAEIDLRFAAKDAVDFARAVRIASERLFGAGGTRVATFSTERVEGAAPPAKEAIVAELSRVAQEIQPQDVFILYLAGHGVSLGGPQGDFYFLTREARNADLKDTAVRQRVALSSEELTDKLKAIPALKQVLILDTCGAGRVVERLAGFRAVPSSQMRALERMKDRTGLFVLAGAAADAVSYEASRYGQGLLTYSLLAAMRGAALREDQFVDVVRLFEYAVDRVPQLASGIGGIQQPLTAIPSGGASFDIGQLGPDDRARIPVASALPIVVRSVFQDETRLVDHLGFAARVNEELRVSAARGSEAPLVFVDAADFPGGHVLSGTYRVTGAAVAVTAGVFEGTKEVGRFRAEGRADALPALARQVAESAQSLLKKKGS